MSLYESLQEHMSNVHIYSEYWMCSCLWHGRDEHASLMVHSDGFKCMTCLKSGSLEFLARTAKIKGIQSVTRSQSVVLPRWKRWEQDYGDLQGIARAAHLGMKRYNQSWYFKKRKIEQFIDVGYFGYLDGWCTFPVFDDKHHVVDMVVRSSKSKQYVVAPNPTHPIYVPSWTKVLESETVYVCYGLIDVWSFYALGLPAITGTSGKSLSAEQLKPLDKSFIIVPDLYEEKDAYLLAGQLGWRSSVLRLKWPDDTKDCDDIRTKYGESYLKEMLMPLTV